LCTLQQAIFEDDYGAMQIAVFAGKIVCICQCLASKEQEIICGLEFGLWEFRAERKSFSILFNECNSTIVLLLGR